MEETQYSRRLDGTGRLIIPSKLREELNLMEGKVYTFSTCEVQGKKYLCIECPDAESDLAKAMKILKKNGLTAVESTN